ncbi:40S ribosomal protein S29-like [Panthera uncia]|uniref:40S ribosomal protein S29-like n=1 Tax=Panthera uncia TaxID=29064 RepID=UPI0020FF9668|nr:40S ribosomal protein S29-like [Panthera uncia]
MGHRRLYWSYRRKCGRGSHSCHICSNQHSPIRKCGLNMCRPCFCQSMKDIGFVKLVEANFLEWVIQDIHLNCRYPRYPP